MSLMTLQVLILRGLPGSGKTTLARQVVATHEYKRVNKDDLRTMLDNGNYTPENERMVEAIRDTIILESLHRGHSVVVDDTNIEGRHIDHIRELLEAKPPRVFTTIEVVVHDLGTPVDECIRRDAARPAPVGEAVIRRMAAQLEAPPA